MDANNSLSFVSTEKQVKILWVAGFFLHAINATVFTICFLIIEEFWSTIGKRNPLPSIFLAGILSFLWNSNNISSADKYLNFHCQAKQMTEKFNKNSTRIPIGNEADFAHFYFCILTTNSIRINNICSSGWRWDILKNTKDNVWLFSGS